MKDCFFCKTYIERKEIDFENEYFYSRLDRFPVSPGHIEVIPKRHVIKLEELTTMEWTSLKHAIKDTINFIENSNLEEIYSKIITQAPNRSSKKFLREAMESHFINLKPQAYNHGINDGEVAGRTINHFHWHIIPRYKGDVLEHKGGIRNVIPGKGSY